MADEFVKEADLAKLAKKHRLAAGKTRAQAARELGVSNPSLFAAEEEPNKSFTKLRCKAIETYSTAKVTGPYYRLSFPKP
jgi:hypothetical protein